MAHKIAIGIWAVVAFLMAAVALNELLRDARVGAMFFSASLAAVSAWLAYRLWRRPSRTVAIIAATTGAFVVVILVGTMFDGSLSPFPIGLIFVSVFLAGAVLPLVVTRHASTAPNKP